MLFVLDSNEYIFSFGLSNKYACETILDIIVDPSPANTIRIPRMITEEVSRNLVPEEFKEFIEFITSLTAIDEDMSVPFELGAKYELLGLKPADAFIAAYTEWVGADALVTENRHFLSLHGNLPFKILTAENCIRFLNK